MEILQEIFTGIFNMSITASLVVLFILIVRHILRMIKSPRDFMYILWVAPLFRFLCPVFITSPISILNIYSNNILSKNGFVEYIPNSIRVIRETSLIQTSNGIYSIYLKSADFWDIALMIFSIIWLLGFLIFIIKNIIKPNIDLRHLRKGAVNLNGNIYVCNHITSPFVYGIIRPKIYIPYGMNAESLSNALKHEFVHIKRLDNLIRLVYTFTYCLHWFNPLAKYSYLKLIQDLELSCDEHVINKYGEEVTLSYSMSLLNVATSNTHGLESTFYSNDTSLEYRISNLLNYRKPAMKTVIIYSVSCAILIFLSMLNPIVKTDVLVNADNVESIQITKMLSSDVFQSYDRTAIRSLADMINENSYVQVSDTLDVGSWIRIVFFSYDGEYLIISADARGIVQFQGDELFYISEGNIFDYKYINGLIY